MDSMGRSNKLKLDRVKQYMRIHRVPKELRRHIFKFYKRARRYSISQSPRLLFFCR
jgi:hypothetical protein